MRTILSLWRHHYLKKVGIFLIVIALVAGVVSCTDDGDGDGTEPTLDHFRVYTINDGQGPYMGEPVYVEDRFCAVNATVGWGATLATPVEKVHDGVTTPISNEDGHYIGYGLEGVEAQSWRVTVSNQFGTQELIVTGPVGLSPPTMKKPHGSPVGLDYFLAYFVTDAPSLNVVVDLQDQFSDAPQSLVLEPFGFGNPAQVTHDGEVTEIVNQDACLVTYSILIEGASMEQHEVVVTNEFGEHHFSVTEQEEGFLVVPSEMIAWEPMAAPLDHFRVYTIDDGQGPYVGEPVYVEDRFGAVNATVGWGATLGTPVEKVHDGVTTPISNEDGHYIGYGLEGVEAQSWRVTVSNQFGTQELIVTGPVGLSPPTMKKPHGSPVGLDYFSAYFVTDAPPLNVVVDLHDQFSDAPQSLVLEPLGISNPAQVTHDGEVTEIVHQDACPVTYSILIEGASMEQHEVVVTNEFGEHHFSVTEQEEGFLNVPSEMIAWEPL